MFCYAHGLPVSTVPGPCDPEDLIDGIIFAANYLGSTQLLSERTPTKSARMQQAQEAMSRVRVRNTRDAGWSFLWCTNYLLLLSVLRLERVQTCTHQYFT